MVDLRNVDDENYNPYDDGWNERINHKYLDDNPFGLNNWKFPEWEKGWLAADKAISKGNKNDE